MRPYLFFDNAVEVLIVDFDKTFIRENLLTQWVLSLLLGARLSGRSKISFFLKSLYGGISSILLSRRQSQAERAVRIAYKTFQGIEIESIQDLIGKKSIWKNDGHAINLNIPLVQILRRVVDSIRRETSREPRVIISSQGSSALAIKTFLEREEVAEQMARLEIRVDSDSIIANRPEVVDGRFTGRLIAPIITKYNRLKLFPKNSVFIGDDKDEAVLRQMANSGVKFVNYKKLAQLHET